MAEILCSICARGGSKGVKNKNIRLINGLELIAYSIYQAKNSKLFKHIVVSTDSDEIAAVAKKHGAEVFFKREAKLSSDTAAKVPVIRDCLLRSEKHYGKKFDYVVDLDATAPLRTSTDIVKAYELFIKEKKENLITACEARKNPYFNMVELKDDKSVVLCKRSSFRRRQDAPPVYDMNASIYIFTRARLMKTDVVFGKHTALYLMDKTSAFDIDDELDFKIVNMLISEKNLKIKDF